MLINIFSKGCDWHYKCEDCSALFIVGRSSIIVRDPIDTNKCIICESKNNKSTPKLTQEQINNKKQELKERLKNER